MLTNSIAYSQVEHGVECKLNLHEPGWQIVCTGVGADKEKAFTEALKVLIRLTTLSTDRIVEILHK